MANLLKNAHRSAESGSLEDRFQQYELILQSGYAETPSSKIFASTNDEEGEPNPKLSICSTDYLNIGRPISDS